ncbi:hypothetical protein KDV38_05640 [Providencia rettgeri]
MDDFDEGWMYRSKNSKQYMDFTDDVVHFSTEVLEDLYLAAQRGALRSYTIAPSKLNVFFQRDLDHDLIPLRTALKNNFDDEEKQIVILLLRLIDSPRKYRETLLEALIVIFKYIFDNSSREKLKVIIKVMIDNNLIDSSEIISALKDEFQQKFNDFFSMEKTYQKAQQHVSGIINFSYESPSNTLDKILAKMVVKDTLAYTIANIIAINIINDLAKASALGKFISRVFLFGSIYGTIERMSMASRELMIKHPIIYAKLREQNLDMFYYFFKSYCDPILDLAFLSDDKFVIDNLYMAFNNAIKGISE